MTVHFPQWRLRFLSVIATLVVCVLLYRIVSVQIIQHATYILKAKGQWHEQICWPARRGSIFDRNGLPLAVTHRTYTVGITPHQVSQNIEARQYLVDLLDIPPKRFARALRKKSAYVPLSRDLYLTEEQVTRLSSLPGVRLDQNQDRLYPFDAVPTRLIGTVNCEGTGVGGLEQAFDDMLAGEDGWLLASKDARDLTIQPVNAPGRKPCDGGNLFVTIDSKIQSIVDFEIEQAVERYGAAGGVAMVIDPCSGDILALAERASASKQGVFAQSRVDALYSVSCIYEPGSTFKLVTDSYLLETGAVSPYDVFYGENGKAKFSFGTFRDDHPNDWLTFKESFVKSSNICTIKAIKESSPQDFYTHVLRFGFGGRTGVDLPAESGGTLNNPDAWTARSLPSISIGHEIGVTVLQMAMAYCTVANGGELVVPRVALAARDGKGRLFKEFPPVAVRRVLSPETALTLRDFCREVVSKGTGAKAAVRGLQVAGKTGTSQKSDGNGYMDGKYIASFIGFAPLGKPRIVCLVVLDEPEYPYYWGGESAAVVFSRIVEGIHLSTDLLYTGTESRIAFECDPAGTIEVPSFLRLTHEQAVELAARVGLQIQSSSGSGIVYSQIPDPGSFVRSGDRVDLLLRRIQGGENERIRVPDVCGLTIREARRLLLGCGLRSSVRGYGVVQQQQPGAGTYIERSGEVALRCAPQCSAARSTRMACISGGSR